MWIVFTFYDYRPESDKTIIGRGIAGMRHIEYSYLKKLPHIGDILKRKVVYPPPWLSLEARHNNYISLSPNRKWSDYYDLSNITNIDHNPPFRFERNGSIAACKSIKYYDAEIDLRLIDKNVEIAVLCNYDDVTKNKYIWTHPFVKYNDVGVRPSDFVKQIADELLSILKIKKYSFLHLRRGDYMDNSILAPFGGTRKYTSPQFVSKFINSNLPNDPVIICTNERDISYIDNLKSLMHNKSCIFEPQIIEMLRKLGYYKDIENDNFMMYQILHVLACRADANVITHELRLGDRYKYKLSSLFLHTIS